MKKIIITPMLKKYCVTLLVRVAVFAAVFFVYFTNKQVLIDFMTYEFSFGVKDHGVTPLHFLWFLFMVTMLLHLFPADFLSMALKKGELKNFIEKEDYDELELYRFVQNQNIKAWTVMLIWLCFNAVFAFLHITGVIDRADLLMLTVFYFLSDYICILFFCPFQDYIMKNKCCVNCRIYDWGHFMMFTPMLFIKNFFSWSLFFTSLVVLIRWEIIYSKHPERFWSGSNKVLQCSECADKTCQFKKITHKNSR